MRVKEFIKMLISTYFALVTMITAAILVLGLYYDPDASFGYSAFAGPLFLAACGLIPSIIMYSKREFTVKEFLVRKGIQLILTEAIILGFMFSGSEFQNRQIDMCICIFVIFILVHVVIRFWNCRSARRMTEDLMRLQQREK